MMCRSWPRSKQPAATSARPVPLAGPLIFTLGGNRFGPIGGMTEALAVHVGADDIHFVRMCGADFRAIDLFARPRSRWLRLRISARSTGSICASRVLLAVTGWSWRAIAIRPHPVEFPRWQLAGQTLWWISVEAAVLGRRHI